MALQEKSWYGVAFLILAFLDGFVWFTILAARGGGELALYFLDVGQGDSELIALPGGVQVLIDGGRDGKVLQELSKVMPAQDRTIELVVMTHPQLDHFGGLIDVLKRYRVGLFLGSGRKGEIDAYRELEATLAERGVRYQIVGKDDRILYGDYRFDVLSPSPADLTSKELNDTSVVMKLEGGGVRALYTGDIGFKVEDELIKSSDLSADILKVPHHGSKFSSGEKFLAAVHPTVSVIGVGKNSYGHPTGQALDRLGKTGARVLRTDENGAVKITLSGAYLDIFAER